MLSRRRQTLVLGILIAVIGIVVSVMLFILPAIHDKQAIEASISETRSQIATLQAQAESPDNAIEPTAEQGQHILSAVPATINETGMRARATELLAANGLQLQSFAMTSEGASFVDKLPPGATPKFVITINATGSITRIANVVNGIEGTIAYQPAGTPVPTVSGQPLTQLVAYNSALRSDGQSDILLRLVSFVPPAQ